MTGERTVEFSVADGLGVIRLNRGTTACAETAQLVAAQVAGRYPLRVGCGPRAALISGWRPGCRPG